MTCNMVLMMTGAHPRAGGENARRAVDSLCRDGSSPRGRGKPLLPATSAPTLRLIPARAGKTLREVSLVPWPAAHPRAGGENPSSVPSSWYSFGSSPRGRGKHGDGWHPVGLPGLIPARAGKTAIRPRRPSSRTAHPRAGGENPPSCWSGSAGRGSSPRGRGKRPCCLELRPDSGLIPARAGKTSFGQGALLGWPAHPRAGGENLQTWGGKISRKGSSPRGRGKPPVPSDVQDRAGLIPARAGKTPPRCHSITPASAHPRAGGENFPRRSAVQSRPGSSPRGRGKLNATMAANPIFRLIPARAGKTQSSRLRPSSRRAHPRAGGENPSVACSFTASVGSSPRGRGKPYGSHTLAVLPGLIPARAGKTGRSGYRAPGGWAHPRAGGENASAVGVGSPLEGSSPRGRGKPFSTRRPP